MGAPISSEINTGCSITHYMFLLLAHGTFVGSMRLEHDKPQQIPIDITISFGASTRTYTLRKRPQAIQTVGSALQDSGEAGESISGLLGLPESETEMDVSEVDLYHVSCIYCMHVHVHTHTPHIHYVLYIKIFIMTLRRI